MSWTTDDKMAFIKASIEGQKVKAGTVQARIGVVLGKGLAAVGVGMDVVGLGDLFEGTHMGMTIGLAQRAQKMAKQPPKKPQETPQEPQGDTQGTIRGLNLHFG